MLRPAVKRDLWWNGALDDLCICALYHCTPPIRIRVAPNHLLQFHVSCVCTVNHILYTNLNCSCSANSEFTFFLYIILSFHLYISNKTQKLKHSKNNLRMEWFIFTCYIEFRKCLGFRHHMSKLKSSQNANFLCCY